MHKISKGKDGGLDMWTDDKYILNHQGEPVKEHSLLAWGTWMQKANRTIAKTKVGKYEVSTVFLGLDYDLFGDGKPILFETMVFADDKKRGEDVDKDGWFNRYSTRQEAIAGHQVIVELVEKTGVQ